MGTHGQNVIVTLRKLIVSGELAPGERVTEIPIAERLGVSRTPIRLAFRALEQEGLLVRAGTRGYRVREFTAEEITGAIEVRGVLEGLAARLVAERGLPRGARAELRGCLRRGDALFRRSVIDELMMAEYHDMNMRYHQVIIEASGNRAIADALTRNDHLPFASMSSIALDTGALDREYLRFRLAHLQHHIVFDALDHGQGSRAESEMREHANAALRYAEMLTGEAPSGAANLKMIDGFG